MILTELQPDQRFEAWDSHVLAYETVFEPFSLQFAAAAMTKLGLGLGLGLAAGQSVLDLGAGSGGAALAMAQSGCQVTAVDAAAGMCARISARAQSRAQFRANARSVPVQALCMDGQALDFAEATFDAALSVFGVVLFPDAVKGLAEMRRVVRPGGRVAVVTWTEPQSYELAVELRAAMTAIRPDLPAAGLPAQLRYRERADFAALFHAAGFDHVDIDVCAATLCAPSARWLSRHLAFAPGMAAQIAGLGSDAAAVEQRFAANLEARLGTGAIALGGKAFVGVAVKT